MLIKRIKDEIEYYLPRAVYIPWAKGHSNSSSWRGEWTSYIIGPGIDTPWQAIIGVILFARACKERQPAPGYEMPKWYNLLMDQFIWPRR